MQFQVSRATIFLEVNGEKFIKSIREIAIHSAHGRSNWRINKLSAEGHVRITPSTVLRENEVALEAFSFDTFHVFATLVDDAKDATDEKLSIVVFFNFKN